MPFTNEPKNSATFTDDSQTNPRLPAGQFDDEAFDRAAFDAVDPGDSWTNQSKS